MPRLPFAIVATTAFFAFGCDDSSPSGAGGAAGGGIGEPSAVYPAPHPDAPTIVNRGGALFAAPKIQPIFFQSDDPATRAALTSFMTELGSTSYWHDVTSEYGIGPAWMLPPIVVAEMPVSPVDNPQIQTWLAGKLNGGAPGFPPEDGNTIYAIAYPPNISVTYAGDGWLSCSNIIAWHDQTALDAAHANAVAPFVVLPRCSPLFGAYGVSGTDLLTRALSHELIETTTDPYVDTTPAFGALDSAHAFYGALFGNELGDLCDFAPDNPESLAISGVGVVQRTLSNTAALAGHDPCVPATPGPYFNAVPVLPDMLDKGNGVKIPAGMSRTIDVKLFSDAPTTGPFTVSATELPVFGAGTSLGFSFDKNAGENGQTLHLTITVLQPGPNNYEVFRLRSILGGRATYWFGLVGN